MTRRRITPQDLAAVGRCRSCYYCESNGKGTRGGQEVDVGLCRASPPQITVAMAGAFPPVTLDLDWCGHHSEIRKAGSNA